MGTFTDNLLKLTEFPFSYSLIGLFSFIIYHESIPSLGVEQLAPLLIFMGFVATTLSMTDPIGVLIKEWLYGFRKRARFVTSKWGISYVSTRLLKSLFPTIDLMGLSQLKGEEKENYHYWLVVEMSRSPLFSTFLSEAFFYKSIIKSSLLISLAPNFLDLVSKGYICLIRFPLSVNQLSLSLSDEELSQVFGTIVSLKEGSVRTTWMVREIDKITGMVYFLIVVGVLITGLSVDLILSAHYLDTFVLSVRGTIPQDELPSDIDFVHTCYPASEQTRDRAAFTPTQFIEYDCFLGRITILGFSLAIFGAVLYKFIRRRTELQSKALTTFKFLLEREAIDIQPTKKEEKATFDNHLHEIEEYLNNGEWTLAELSCQQVMKEYDDFMRRELIEKKKITAVEGKDVEKMK